MFFSSAGRGYLAKVSADTAEHNRNPDKRGFRVVSVVGSGSRLAESISHFVGGFFNLP